MLWLPLEKKLKPRALTPPLRSLTWSPASSGGGDGCGNSGGSGDGGSGGDGTVVVVVVEMVTVVMMAMIVLGVFLRKEQKLFAL